MKKDLRNFPKLAYQTEENDGVDLQYLGKEGIQIINDQIELYSHYDKSHWQDAEGNPITPEQLQTDLDLDYTPTIIDANLSAWFVNKRSAFMFERPLNLNCPVKQVDDEDAQLKEGYQPSDKQKAAKQEAAAREKLLYQVMKANLLGEKLLKAAKDYYIGGAIAVKLHMDPNKGMRLIWKPRMEYWAVYDTDDTDELIRIHLLAFTADDTIWKQTHWMEPTTGTCWMNEKLYDLKLTVKKTIVEDLDLEYPFIPFEIINRGGLTGETEGRSLLKEIKGLNEEVEKKLSDNSDGLRFGMFSMLALVNAQLPSAEDIKSGRAQAFKYAPNSVVSIQSPYAEIPADLKRVESTFGYNDTLNDQLNNLLKLMHRLAEVPQVDDPDKLTGLGNVSGIALKIIYGAIISATNQEMITWKPRLNRLLGKALYILSKYNSSKFYDTELLNAANLTNIKAGEIDNLVEVTTSMPIPENDMEKLDYHTKKVAAMLESIEQAMNELGIENPKKTIAEILYEKKTIREALGGFPDQEESDEGNGGGTSGGTGGTTEE